MSRSRGVNAEDEESRSQGVEESRSHGVKAGVAIRKFVGTKGSDDARNLVCYTMGNAICYTNDGK